MILLDTNVISALMTAKPDAAVVNWMDLQPRDSIWITSITLMELRFGLESMPAGKKREALSGKLGILLSHKIDRRVAPFDATAAEQTARLMAERIQVGRVVELRDTMIAGIALSCNASLATRNVAHFRELANRLINPWTD
jgi:toxin FitB